MAIKQTAPYVDERDGSHYVAGSRVSLESIVCAFLNGDTAEGIAQSFPVLSLEQVYGALTYYLANRPEIDEALVRSRADFEKQRESSRQSDPMFYQKMTRAREHADR